MILHGAVRSQPRNQHDRIIKVFVRNTRGHWMHVQNTVFNEHLGTGTIT